MPKRRILSLWFNRFGAERLLRQRGQLHDRPLVIVEDLGQIKILSSLSERATQEGLHRNQPLRDAQAMCPNLITEIRNKPAEELFLRALARWVEKFSPWVAIESSDSLILDITGCAHLFGGEARMMEQIRQEAHNLGFNISLGIADTRGAAWALARYAGQEPKSHRNRDSIDQEARATRSRAAKRGHLELAGTIPKNVTFSDPCINIAAPGKIHSALKTLPVEALRLDSKVSEELKRLGLRRIGDLSIQPRSALARRFGKGLVEQLDKALGSLQEPISPLPNIPHFGVRMSFPEPIGLNEDITLAIDRLLPRLCEKLKIQGFGLRQLKFQCFHTDNTISQLVFGLTRPSDEPSRIRPLIVVKLDKIKADAGIDIIRLEATETQILHASSSKGQMVLQTKLKNAPSPTTAALDDLLNQIGGRVGLENITRTHPADSHIPEKEFQVLSAAWSEPAKDWPDSYKRRPLFLWHPEPVKAPQNRRIPIEFKWRGRNLRTLRAQGPERIAPEWWLDDPNWRSGVRDYWQITCREGDLLWLFYAHGATMPAGWFCQGSFT